jgi:hypothetical protein
MHGLNDVDFHSVDEDSVEQFAEIAVIQISEIVRNFCHSCQRLDKQFTIVINLFGPLNPGKLRRLNDVDFHSVDEESVEQFAEIAVIHISKIVHNFCKCYRRLDKQFTVGENDLQIWSVVQKIFRRLVRNRRIW